MRVSKELASKHYAEHKKRPFYTDLIQYITKDPCVSIVLQGNDVINQTRQINGATDPKEAVPGSIRGDFGLSKRFNLVHSSDSLESAAREINLFFTQGELVQYELSQKNWYLD